MTDKSSKKITGCGKSACACAASDGQTTIRCPANDAKTAEMTMTTDTDTSCDHTDSCCGGDTSETASSGTNTSCCGVVTRDRSGAFGISNGSLPSDLQLESATPLGFILRCQAFGSCTVSVMAAAKWILRLDDDVVHTADADARYAGSFVIPVEPGGRIVFGAEATSPRHATQPSSSSSSSSVDMEPPRSPAAVFVGFRRLRRGS